MKKFIRITPKINYAEKIYDNRLKIVKRLAADIIKSYDDIDAICEMIKFDDHYKIKIFDKKKNFLGYFFGPLNSKYWFK